MPSNPAKYGLKLWMLANAKFYYLFYASVCIEKDPTSDCGSRSLGLQVVMKATGTSWNAKI